jgi:hypothetical protein
MAHFSGLGSFLSMRYLVKVSVKNWPTFLLQKTEMLNAQATIPIMDVVKLGEDEHMTETYSLPLFPVVPREERTQFLQYLELLSGWYQEFAAFLGSTGEH